MKHHARMRHGVLAMIWLLLGAMIVGRLVGLLKQQQFLSDKSRYASHKTHTYQSTRGQIVAQNGAMVAYDKSYKSLAINPRVILKKEYVISRLARVMGVAPVSLTKKISARKKSHFMWLKRFMVAQDQSIDEDLRDIEGVYWLPDRQRSYPYSDEMGPIIGRTDVDGAGIEGLEYQLDKQLKGKSGYEKIIITPQGDTVEVVERKHQVISPEVRISLDPCIQHQAHETIREAVERHQALRGGAIVIDIPTGQIKALVHVHNTNRSHGANTQKAWMLTDLYEPGSLFKPISMSYVLAQSKENIRDKIVQTHQGQWHFNKETIIDVHKASEMSVVDVLTKSSNIGMSKLILEVPRGIQRWVVEQWPILSRTGLGFPGEPRGRVVSNPSEFETATLSFGYGISMTMMQLAKAYLAIANGGFEQPICLVNCNKSGTVFTKQRVMSEETHQLLKHMLTRAVSKGGTGYKAQSKGSSVAGKTGTAHKISQGKYQKNRYVASFAGFSPVDKPKWVVVVLIDDPLSKGYYGGEVAAPLFSHIVFDSAFQCKSK